MLTDSYLKAAAAHDREVEDRAPYNQPDGIADEVRCEMCGMPLSFLELSKHIAHEKKTGKQWEPLCFACEQQLP